MRTTVRNSYTPKTGDYCNMIVVDDDKQVQYIFDSDGVWTQYTSKTQEGAPKSYVDSRDASTLQEAKLYAANADANILQAAKDYTDAYVPTGMATESYVDTAAANALQDAKDYADGKDVLVLQDAQALISSATGSVTHDLELEIQTLSNSLSSVATSGSYNDLTDKPTVPVIMLTDTDPGEGVALAANHFIAVYAGDPGSE